MHIRHRPLSWFNWRQCSLLIIAIVLLLLLVIPGSGPSMEDLLAVDYTPLPGDNWEASTPAAQGLDPMLVAQVYYNAAELETLYSLLVIKNGYLIAEGYFNEGSIDQKDRLQSVTKSYTSALVGIALDQGYLSRVDQKMLDFFPEVAAQITDPRKEQITIRDLLEMRSGYPWEETAPALWDGLLSGHYPPLIEGFPLVADPGTEFNYSNLSSDWLGIIVDRATGMSLEAYAEENLFLPLGVEAGEWGTDAEGHNNGAADLHMTPRDAARFGLLYVNDGKYQGNQIVPADWVHDSLRRYSKDINVTGGFPANWGLSFRDVGYGYQWWSARVGDHHFDYAMGHGGQMIVLLDEFDMVIVTTSYPFYLQHDAEAWKHELAIMNLVGDFIGSLPTE
jgi:CubicO group peptidase (beta-lactamase class C family)